MDRDDGRVRIPNSGLEALVVLQAAAKTAERAAQNLSLQNNTKLVEITVTSQRMPAMINVSIDDMLSICDQALRMCELSCECSREQSKACPLRRALDTIPCEMGSGAWEDAGKCPYRGLRVEWEEVLGDECDAGEAQAAQGC